MDFVEYLVVETQSLEVLFFSFFVEVVEIDFVGRFDVISQSKYSGHWFMIICKKRRMFFSYI